MLTAQAKERLGSYRYYTHDWGWPEVVAASDALRDAWRRIDAIASGSTRLCQVCGTSGERHVHDHWHATLCPAHAVAWMVDRRTLGNLYREREAGRGREGM